jgi:hypothetical protein
MRVPLSNFGVKTKKVALRQEERLDDYLFTFPTRDFDDGAGVVFVPLSLPARKGLDTAIGPGRQAPEEIHVSSVAGPIETRGNNQKIDIAPVICPAYCLQ